ncbi:MAG: ABC transporter substrate-binding protein, partial [Candidatus Parcubacteria bacterium]|nr:ABC transporter substrate-binding protein [Candidatus Parcubacteria bacterium]
VSQSNEITTNAQLGPYTFHEALTPQMNVKSMGRWVLNNLSDSWFLMVADYAWGNQCLKIYLDFAKKYNIKVKGIIKFPLGSNSFTRYFPEIVRSKAETLILTCWGTDQVAFIEQSMKYGLKRKLSIVHSISDISIAKNMDANAAAGMYWGTNFYWGISQNIESAKRFTDNFKRAFHVLPSGYTGYAYSGVKELLLAAERSGEYPINPEKITADLEGRTYNHYKGKQWWRPCDHQSFQDLYIMKFKGPEERKNSDDIAEFVNSVPWDMEIERTCQELDNASHIWGHIQKK